MIRRHSTKLLLLGVMASGAVMYPEMLGFSAPGDTPAATTASTVQAISALKAQISQATDAKAQGELRLKLADAYMVHGRPIEAAAELQLWLRANPQGASREGVMLKLVAANRQSNNWDGAASIVRSYLRDFPQSKQREAVYQGLVEITRYGQTNLGSEASALADWIKEFPASAGTSERMLRLARVQEQVGDAASAVATLQKFAATYPNDPESQNSAWRAAYLMHDRLRKTGEAVTAAQAHLKKYPNRPAAAGEWKWVGDIARSIDKWADAMEAYRNALKADPKNREILSTYIDAAGFCRSEPELTSALAIAQSNFPGDGLVLEAKLSLLRVAMWKDKADRKAVIEQAKAFTANSYKIGDVGGLMQWGIDQEPEKERGALWTSLVAFYAAELPKKQGWPRMEMALRYNAALRNVGKLEEATQVLEKELRENPMNGRDVVREFIIGPLYSQQWEVQAKKRTTYEMEPIIKRLMAAAGPSIYMPEVRNGLDDVINVLGQGFKLREESESLRRQMETAASQEGPAAVETFRQEWWRNSRKAVDALSVLNKGFRDKPLVYEILGDGPVNMIDRLSPEDRAKLVPYFQAWSAARPGDVWVQQLAAEGLRRMGKNEDARTLLDKTFAQGVTDANYYWMPQAVGVYLNCQVGGMETLDRLAAILDKAALRSAPIVRQERYRQMADAYLREKDGYAKGIAYLRKAADLGLSNQGYEAAKSLLQVLPAKDAVELGRKFITDPANNGYAAELSLLVANRLATGMKDLPAAVDLMIQANQLRLNGFRAEWDHWNTLREIPNIALELSEPGRVNNEDRKAFLKGFKPLSPEQTDALLNVVLEWGSSQQLQETGREVIRRAGARQDRARQLDVFSQMLSRTRANDQWYWDRNMEIVREEISRGNDGTASTMLRLLLKQSASYNSDSRAQARNLLLSTYRKFGEDLLAVDDKSPIAPLLRGENYLRLGEEKQAWAAYQANAELFAQKVDEVPSDYVLFVANELATGSDADRDQAEQMLRLWLARTEKRGEMDPIVRAAVSLKLADVFYYGKRYDVARAEYQGVIDRFPDGAQATEARFRIGESFMHQKNYGEATKTFEGLRHSRDAETAIRGTFMMGVLQYTQQQRAEARETFKSLLDLSPSEELASKTLFQLALIYGDDNRFRESLDMLETIGRLGREGKRWHTPGQPLTVMIHDPDMAIVQGAKTVPVLVSTSNGDRELVTLVAGAAGKGIYLAPLPTSLGAAKANDGILQLLGNDVITYDYPEDFKARFKYVPAPQGSIRIASDATFDASAMKIGDEARDSVMQRATRGNKIERAEDEAKEFRSPTQVKPGNPIYIRVVDADRTITTDINRVEVTLRASSGDSVRAFISESGRYTGIFEGTVKTAERPPEAVASDSALGRPAALAADRDAATAWESQHDGQAGKWIAADLKDVYPIKTISISTPNPKANAPIDYVIETSANGQIWEPLYSTTKGRVAHGMTMSFGPMRYTHYAWSKVKAKLDPKAKAPESYAGYANLLQANIPDLDSTKVESFEVDDSVQDAEGDVHQFAGYFFVPTAGTYQFQQRGQGGALVIDGRIIGASVNDFQWNGAAANLTAGWHRLVSFTTVRGRDGSAPKKGSHGLFVNAPNRGNSYDQALIEPKTAGDAMPAPSTLAVPDVPLVTPEGGTTKFEVKSVPARFVRLNIEKYSGDFVAISDFTVTGADGKVLLPTAANLVSLSDNDVLEVSPGDEISISYVDQINTRTPGEARVLSSKLHATYYNATVEAIAYEVVSTPAGVQRTPKALYRIDPGDRIIAHITDYDEDTGPDINKVPFRIRTESGAELVLEATETDPTTGEFTKEIDTCDAGKPEPGKLAVRPGERVYIIYSDRLNTSPGSRVDRTANVTVAKPTDAVANFLSTRVEQPAASTSKLVEVKAAAPRVIYLPPEKDRPSRVVLAAPLTVEVIDQDRAKDSHSTVNVEITTNSGAKLSLPLELSQSMNNRWGGRDAADVGRFAGQALMILGKPEEGRQVDSIDIERARELIGAWRYKGNADDAGDIKPPVLFVTGADEIKVTYQDERTVSGTPAERTGTARMVTDATLTNLGRGFQDPAVNILHLGEKLYLRVEDADRDATADADVIEAQLTSSLGEKYTVKLRETMGHSGVFTAEIPLVHAEKPTPGNDVMETNFGDELTIVYKDDANTSSLTSIDRMLKLKVALGADAVVQAFSKQFGSEELAVETQFKLAECHFELFKSHMQLKATAEATASLQAGRAVLAQVRDNYRNSAYEARVLYLLGSFHQELKEYEKAIEAFSTVVRVYQNSPLAPDAQYKLAQCYEDKMDMDRACEEYVRLAYTYPDNPLIAKCMVRLSEYFYKSNNFMVAANICGQFMEQYPEHEWAARIAFRQGQCYFKAAEAAQKAGQNAVALYLQAAKAFDSLVENYKDADLRPEGMFWAGQSYHKGGDAVLAYRRYRRVTWDFPDSDAAKYARGQLTLPEIQKAGEADQAQ